MTILAFPPRARARIPHRDADEAARDYLDCCAQAAGAALDAGDFAEALQQIADILSYAPPPAADRRAIDRDAADLAAALTARASGRMAIHSERLRKGAL
jgi:hypothetical protein